MTSQADFQNQIEGQSCFRQNFLLKDSTPIPMESFAVDGTSTVICELARDCQVLIKNCSHIYESDTWDILVEYLVLRRHILISRISRVAAFQYQM